MVPTSVRSRIPGLVALVSCCAVLGVVAASADRGAPNEKISAALVKVHTIANPPDLVSPWQKLGTDSRSGSGVILEGQRILTNAHVVAHHVSVEVKRSGTTKRYTAQVEHVGHECDLALLTVADAAFFESAEPLAIGDLPRIQDEVDVYGFPLGGETISVTSGVVSRIELGIYAHSLAELLEVQVDAAINSGNSGGPVIAGRKVVGIAAQTLEDAENIGYMIPPPVIRHFLKDIEDGHFDGFPQLGAQCQPIENESLRRFLKMGESRTGGLITRIQFGMGAWGILEVGDVLLEADGVPIANDLTVPVQDQRRVHYDHLFHMKQVGEAVTLAVLRDGRRLEKDVVLNNTSSLVAECQHARRPSYLILGGLVFQPLDMDYVLLFESTPEDLGNYLLYQNVASPERQQVVLISKVLAHPLNRGYHDWEDVIVRSVNGVRPRDMAHLAVLLERASDPWLRIEAEDGSLVVLNLEEARAAHAAILENYGVPEDRSPDLRLVTGMAP